MAEPAVHELVSSEPGVEVIWRAFELRPEPVPTLDPGGEYLQRVWGSSVLPLAERLGMAMKLPPVQPRSRLAHQAAQWARRQGQFDEYHAAVFRALFERGEDIGDIEVLSSLASEMGLDGEALRQTLENRELEASVIEDERDAEASGIRGVPAFIADRRAAMSGVQSVEGLRRLIEHGRASDGHQK